MPMASWLNGSRVIAFIRHCHCHRNYIPNLKCPKATAQQSVNASSGLTTGTKAGIGVGVAVGAIYTLLALGLFVCRRRKRQAQLDPNRVRGSSKLLN
ncbi:hypothetical protein PENSUB_13900 [Penicillium subrubescens]|uniref:Uncharacterized protein n=1 Tax=Penicillium subrubescens TaxID=1316194 RepID=A0A1Q5UPZ5_9EURO|nr:hypothetical protein PENSUB_13900 [Penicillium subrubescens]